MTAADRYLDLLAKAVTGELSAAAETRLLYLRRCMRAVDVYRESTLLDIEHHRPELTREYMHAIGEGRAPSDDLAELGFNATMIGQRRIQHLWRCLDTLEREAIEGDLMECGVWRGGAALFMRGWLAAREDRTRIVWLADSFAGLPPATHPQESEDLRASDYPMLVVSLDTVRDLFSRYGLLDEQVRFMPGWFAETLRESETSKLALLRIDADYYSSTMECLTALYDRVTPGGFIIVDDYGAVTACRRAVEEFRQVRGITAELESIDWTAVCWRA